ncbi:MlaD family protein [Nocardia bovistercoris]|uniref:MCE family protein n=1 Tax=Nocardia bovistercoris TaxID=2785916 RepID=A0A931I908_9NOCA|nr:MCE family protein [Nocardia bovistercoris]MBH0776311.1 MCE family protein [Nocardia bovistercoris]
MNRRTHAVPLVIAAAVLASGVTGCSASLDQLPLPSPGLDSAAYSLTATFDNALNLPTKAKVRLNGADIGEVESMVARNYVAEVTLRIRSGVELPVGTTAELRSATPMGDVFVAVSPPKTPAPDGAVLHDGATIPIENTSAASTIEEALSRASLLVSGSTLENLTHVVTALGEYVGGRGDRLAALITHTRSMLDTLATRSDQINHAVAGAAELSNTVAAQQNSINDAVAAAGPALEVVAENTDGLLDLVDRIHAITDQLARFPTIQGTNNGSMAEDIDLLAKGLADAAGHPDAELDALNSIIAVVMKLTSSSSAHVVVDVNKLAAGAVPDPGFPGTPGARLPDTTDWTTFVGSLQYMLERLGGRLDGAPR